jgi:hypothetical protein
MARKPDINLQEMNYDQLVALRDQVEPLIAQRSRSGKEVGAQAVLPCATATPPIRR